jgi:hypothetical protein
MSAEWLTLWAAPLMQESGLPSSPRELGKVVTVDNHWGSSPLAQSL